MILGLLISSKEPLSRKDGFPISYEIFEGNTFEGDTFIPVITGFKKKHAINSLTVVADAAMISFDNIEKLKENSLSYIVGGRIANLKRSEMEEISTALIGQTSSEDELRKKDSISTRIETERGLLVCDFFFKRYQKDKREMEKQIAKAKLQLEKKVPVKRIKFLKNKDKKKTDQILNIDLIEKTKIKRLYSKITASAGA